VKIDGFGVRTPKGAATGAGVSLMSGVMIKRCLVLLFCLVCSYSCVGAEPPNIRVIEINDHILAFYTGRESDYDPDAQRNWAELGALDLGVATYAIHRGREAVIYDTFTASQEAGFVRTHLEKWV
jgi:hypothetical protein